MLKIKETHSKLKEVEYSKLEMQHYIKSDSNLTDDEKCLLFQFRVRQIDVKCNYKNKYFIHNCDICTSNEKDDQYHLLQCEYLIKHCKKLAENTTVEYEDLFGDKEKQFQAAKLLIEVWEKRKELISQ